MKKGVNKGITPTITLFCPTELTVVDDEGCIYLGWDCPLVAVDGETQVATRSKLKTTSWSGHRTKCR